MKNQPTIGQEVVRSQGDYVVGSVGNVIDIDTDKNRAQVSWKGSCKTWVSVKVIEPTSIPYVIVEGKSKWPKYRVV